jgi:hypothetical protein
VVGVGRHDACHHVHAVVAEHGSVFEGLRERRAELGLAAGQGGDATLAGAPVTGRRVEQGLGQAVVVEPLADLGGRMVVREQVLDGLEPVLAAAAKRSRNRAPCTSSKGSRRSAACQVSLSFRFDISG